MSKNHLRTSEFGTNGIKKRKKHMKKEKCDEKRICVTNNRNHKIRKRLFFFILFKVRQDHSNFAL